MSEPNPGGPLLLRSKDAAELLQISERQLWTLTRMGKIPAVFFGRCKRYDLRDLVAFVDRLKNQERQP